MCVRLLIGVDFSMQEVEDGPRPGTQEEVYPKERTGERSGSQGNLKE
jgi:hypothetical protein